MTTDTDHIKGKPGRKKKTILVVDCKGIVIKRREYQFTVQGGLKKRLTYHPTLRSAMSELSIRLFEETLVARDATGKTDIQSLLELIKAHNDEIILLYETSELIK